MTNGAATLRIKDVIEYFPLPDEFKILLLTKMSSPPPLPVSDIRNTNFLYY